MPDFIEGDIHSVLDSIAVAFDFNTDDLIKYAAEDPHGGYNSKYDDGCPIGSLWRVEGQILYALVRALKPDKCLELGTFRGCSASHIAQALSDNVFGSLLCVSLEGCLDCIIPQSLQHRVEIVKDNLFNFLPRQSQDMTPKYDFIFEDDDHSMESTEFVWRAAYTLLKPGGVMVTHDAAHFLVGQAERAGIARAGYFSLDKPAKVYLIKPSDCGIAVWRKPDHRLLTQALMDASQYTVVPEVWTEIQPYFTGWSRTQLKQYAEKSKNKQFDPAMLTYSVPEKPKNDTLPAALDNMSLRELKEYAYLHNIPLGKTRAKADVIAQILEAERG